MNFGNRYFTKTWARAPDDVVVLSEVFNLGKHQFQRDEPENLCIRVGLVIDVVHDVEDMSYVEHEGLIAPRLEVLGGVETVDHLPVDPAVLWALDSSLPLSRHFALNHTFEVSALAVDINVLYGKVDEMSTRE